MCHGGRTHRKRPFQRACIESQQICGRGFMFHVSKNPASSAAPTSPPSFTSCTSVPPAVANQSARIAPSRSPNGYSHQARDCSDWLPNASQGLTLHIPFFSRGSLALARQDASMPCSFCRAIRDAPGFDSLTPLARLPVTSHAGHSRGGSRQTCRRPSRDHPPDRQLPRRHKLQPAWLPH